VGCRFINYSLDRSHPHPSGSTHLISQLRFVIMHCEATARIASFSNMSRLAIVTGCDTAELPTVSADRKQTHMENSKAQFVLRGFRQVAGFRVFTFEGIAADHSRALFTVRADLALAQRHRIPLQELPLLCRAVLERLHDDADKRAFVFSEADMRLQADVVAARAEAARQKRPPRRPPTENVGAGWRNPQGR
jgi:hypothetical protein